jgi:hypothetical protein
MDSATQASTHDIAAEQPLERQAGFMPRLDCPYLLAQRAEKS